MQHLLQCTITPEGPCCQIRGNAEAGDQPHDGSEDASWANRPHQAIFPVYCPRARLACRAASRRVRPRCRTSVTRCANLPWSASFALQPDWGVRRLRSPHVCPGARQPAGRRRDGQRAARDRDRRGNLYKSITVPATRKSDAGPRRGDSMPATSFTTRCVRNPGEAPVSDVVVTKRLPFGVRYHPGSATGPACKVQFSVDGA